MVPAERAYCLMSNEVFFLKTGTVKVVLAAFRHDAVWRLCLVQDEEVERLERASHAVCSTPSRQEVMESMYGRADPKPQGIHMYPG
jgi:hypothetical protein